MITLVMPLQLLLSTINLSANITWILFDSEVSVIVGFLQKDVLTILTLILGRFSSNKFQCLTKPISSHLDHERFPCA